MAHDTTYLRELAWSIMADNKRAVDECGVLDQDQLASMNRKWDMWRREVADVGLSPEQADLIKREARIMLIACPMLPERQE